MKKRLLLLSSMMMCILVSTAQVELPMQCEVSRPKVVDQEFIHDSDIKELVSSLDWGQSKKTNAYWIVYSDRTDNTLYDNPSSQAVRIGVLAFNEEVRIAQIKNDYALVYVEKVPSVPYPKIHTPGKRGWIPMRNLLLWNSCQANSMGIYHKALPVANKVSHSELKSELVLEGLPRIVFDTPEVNSLVEGHKIMPEFYFVMKEDSSTNMVLLSRRYMLHTGTLSQVLYGWVNKSSLIFWDQRICLEPKWIPEFDSSNDLVLQIPVYSDEHLTKVIDTISVDKSHFEMESKIYRISTSDMRYVLLGSVPDRNLYKILYRMPNCLESLNNIEDNQRCGNTIYVTAYVPVENYWKPVVYFSKAEYNEMMAMLLDVETAAIEGSSDRRPYIEAMKTLTKVLYGDISESKIMSMDTKQVMALIAGLPVKSDALKGRTLLQIEDSQVVSKDEFNTLISDFDKKYKKLDRIKNGYKYSVELSGDTWYLIPVDDLP